MSIDVNQSAEAAESALFKKIAWRLMPLMSIAYLVAQIDRINVSFAKIQMLDDLKFTETVYGLGAGIFFLGYCLFEVPSNLVIKKIGARVWLGAIMILWGLLSTVTMFVTTPMEFYIVRFFLGVAEAGFFPGLLYYMTFWFTARERGRMTALLMSAIAASGLLAGPISGAIMEGFDTVYGLRGWQWVFLIEGMPAVFLGVIWMMYIESTPETARWLNPGEKALLADLLQKEALAAPHGGKEARLTTVMLSPPVWGLSLLYICYGMAFFGIVFWLPSIIRDTGVQSPFIIGLLTMIPWGVSVIVMNLLAGYVARKQNSRQVLIALAVAAAAGFILLLNSKSTVVSLVALTIAMSTVMASLPIFWNFPTRLFSGVAAAVGIALITSIGNLGGLVSPYLMGWSQDTFGNLDVAMYAFVGSMFVAILFLLALPKRMDVVRTNAA